MIVGEKTKGIVNFFAEEYRSFLQKYLLPLLGVVDGVIDPYTGNTDSTQTNEVLYRLNDVYVFSAGGKPIAKFYHPSELVEDDIKLAKNIINAFLLLSEYRMADSLSKPRRLSEVQKDAIYRMAVQRGICNWIIGSNNLATELLMSKLERWSVQTYEGRRVSFGFIINSETTVPSLSDKYGTWLDFMDSDYAAVLTDCIHSVIELDKNCNLTRYLSLQDNGRIPACTPRDEIPLRFANVIQRYVTGANVGIFLLVNGDIIIAKRQQVKLVKRNLKWLNLSYNAFINAIENSNSVFVKSLSSTERGKESSLLSTIYASILDVSFSHTGGIISVVSSNALSVTDHAEVPSESHNVESLFSILAKNDILKDSIAENDIQEEFQKSGISTPEQKKRLLKRTVLQKLVAGKTFTEMDRKLRNELISWDGACIIDENGEVISFGAIIRNDKGSSEGGRGAAARSLSKYGMAIKISTDGYIELFVDGEEKPSYAIK